MIYSMLLQGKELANTLRAPLAQRAAKVCQQLGRPISLVAIGSTDDYGAYVYLKKEVQAAEKLGVHTTVHEISSKTSAADFIALIDHASADPAVDAILIPRPLPDALAQSGFMQHIAPEKDIDGMSHISMGNLFLCKTWEDIKHLNTFIPCTAAAVIRLLDFYHLSVQGLEAVVIGRSPTVGKPLAHLLTCRNATVKICHTFTSDLAASLQNAQLICCAAGKPGLLHGGNVPAGCLVIDIATNLDKNQQLCGDALTQELLAKNCTVSAVPGGVGPVTLACLLENIILSGERKLEGKK